MTKRLRGFQAHAKRHRKRVRATTAAVDLNRHRVVRPRWISAVRQGCDCGGFSSLGDGAKGHYSKSGAHSTGMQNLEAKELQRHRKCRSVIAVAEQIVFDVRLWKTDNGAARSIEAEHRNARNFHP